MRFAEMLGQFGALRSERLKVDMSQSETTQCKVVTVPAMRSGRPSEDVVVALAVPASASDQIAERVNPGERIAALALFAVMFILRLICAFHYPINSDEPQHLHVVWGWTRGLLQYRDVFDNHTPLFHLLCAPLLTLIGERPSALLWMRLAMVPIVALLLGGTYALGRMLFSPRVGLWAAVFLGLYPSFFMISVEFRPDTLWAALWLWALVVLLGGPGTFVRSMVGGAVLGVALGVSLKTTLLLGSLGAAVLLSLAMARWHGSRICLRSLIQRGTGFLIGLVPVPLALTLLFVVKGAVGPFLYGVFRHNTLRGLGLWGKIPQRALLFPALLCFLMWFAFIVLRQASRLELGIRRVIVLLSAGIYIAGLTILWPLAERENKLPFYPLILLSPTFLIVWLLEWIMELSPTIRVGRAFGTLAPVMVAIGEVIALLTSRPVWRDYTIEHTQFISDVLRLTDPDDLVLDGKGRTIFRQRPLYYALEEITRRKLELGLITDDIPERLIATRTAVAVVNTGRFPPRARQFIAENYISVGTVSVAGCFLVPEGDELRSPISFEVRLPARYAIVTESGSSTGSLDSTPYSGPRFLEAGEHQFVPSGGEGRVALLWEQAAERGFSPF